MKKEILKFDQVSVRINDESAGPFFLRFCEKEIHGIVVDDYFDKRLLTYMIRGLTTYEDGRIYIDENKWTSGFYETNLSGRLTGVVSVISERSGLYETLPIIDNIFFPGYLVRTSGYRKILMALMEYYEINIPLTAHVSALSFWERIQVELLHAIACHCRLIVISGINKFLNDEEMEEMLRLYRKISELGMSICLIETLSDMVLDYPDRLSVVSHNRSVGSFYRNEQDYYSLYNELNYYGCKEEAESLSERELYSSEDSNQVLRFIQIKDDFFRGIEFELRKGEILEVNCRDRQSYQQIKRILLSQNDIHSGLIFFDGKQITAADIKKQMSAGQIVSIESEHVRRYLFQNLSIEENIFYPLSLRMLGFYIKGKVIREKTDYVKSLLKGINLKAKAEDLSWSEALEIVITKNLVCLPKVCIIMLPFSRASEGLNLMTRKLLHELSRQGTAVLVLSEVYQTEADVIDYQVILKSGYIVQKRNLRKPDENR